MKKIHLSFVLLCLLSVQAWAQIRYESVNYYGNGITEYIEMEIIQTPEYTYYTSENPNKRIKLLWGFEENEIYLQFPGDEKKYRWLGNDEFGSSITCLHPTGNGQPYLRSADPNPPFKYLRSKNPYTGSVEELKFNDETFWYRSNKQTAWVKLRTVRKERPEANNYGYDVYFPNENTAYQLTFLEGMMDMECKNPDGSKQIFYNTNMVTVK
ncbi:MAG: hypothetical protein EAZ55_11110 [Cytophagales bacterium]|nr:MAG: hypothetical protein EAZ55_11110 [Cytophagales bacterium]